MRVKASQCKLASHITCVTHVEAEMHAREQGQTPRKQGEMSRGKALNQRKVTERNRTNLRFRGSRQRGWRNCPLRYTRNRTVFGFRRQTDHHPTVDAEQSKIWSKFRGSVAERLVSVDTERGKIWGLAEAWANASLSYTVPFLNKMDLTLSCTVLMSP